MWSPTGREKLLDIYLHAQQVFLSAEYRNQLHDVLSLRHKLVYAGMRLCLLYRDCVRRSNASHRFNSYRGQFPSRYTIKSVALVDVVHASLS
jgi:hypothetical protein